MKASTWLEKWKKKKKNNVEKNVCFPFVYFSFGIYRRRDRQIYNNFGIL